MSTSTAIILQFCVVSISGHQTSLEIRKFHDPGHEVKLPKAMASNLLYKLDFAPAQRASRGVVIDILTFVMMISYFFQDSRTIIKGQFKTK